MPAHQSLQQFINQSPWRWAPVRALLARYVQSVAPPQAWVLSRVVIPKRGDRSVGVERQFLPEAGRMVNCQIGLAVSLVTPASSLPVNWRILLPKSWEGQRIRKAAHIPDHVEPRPEWLEAAGMLEEMSERWGLMRVPIVASVRQTGNGTALLRELAARDLPFLVEVAEPPEPAALPPAPRSRSRFARGPLEKVITAREYLHALTGHRHHAVPAASPAARRSFVRSSLTKIPAANGAPPKAARLLTEIAPGGQAVRFWVTNLMDHRIDDLMALARLEPRSREDMQKLEQNFGLRDFEGRSFRGWHHHMTMVSAAYVFATVGWDALASCACCS